MNNQAAPYHNPCCSIGWLVFLPCDEGSAQVPVQAVHGMLLQVAVAVLAYGT